VLSSEAIGHTTRVHTICWLKYETSALIIHLNQIKEFDQDARDVHELDTPSWHEPLIEQFFDDDSIFLDELVKDDLVMHTSLKHIDHNFEDVCVDDEPMFFEEFFKDECFKKTWVEELKSKVHFEKRKFDLSIFTFDEPSNNQSFKNWVQFNKTDEKD